MIFSFLLIGNDFLVELLWRSFLHFSSLLLNLSVNLLMKAIFNLDSAEVSQYSFLGVYKAHIKYTGFINLVIISKANPYGLGERI